MSRKSVSVVFRSRADQEVCRGPYVGTDPSADIDLGDAAGSAGGAAALASLSIPLRPPTCPFA